MVAAVASSKTTDAPVLGSDDGVGRGVTDRVGTSTNKLEHSSNSISGFTSGSLIAALGAKETEGRLGSSLEATGFVSKGDEDLPDRTLTSMAGPSGTSVTAKTWKELISIPEFQPLELLISRPEKSTVGSGTITIPTCW